MRAEVLWIAGMMLAAALPSAAQEVTHPQPSFGVMGGMGDGAQTTAVQAVPDASTSCPAAMHVQRRSGLGVVQARDGDKPVVGQRIYLEIERGKLGIIEVRVTVYGTRAQGRNSLVLTSSGAKGTPEVTRSFTLKPGKKDAEKIASELVLEGFTSVQSVRLDAATYADGSDWKPAVGHSCTVEPDPLMLVSQR